MGNPICINQHPAVQGTLIQVDMAYHWFADPIGYGLILWFIKCSELDLDLLLHPEAVGHPIPTFDNLSFLCLIAVPALEKMVKWVPAQ